jgi:tetratricopeptide (TPR) repeat protein
MVSLATCQREECLLLYRLIAIGMTCTALLFAGSDWNRRHQEAMDAVRANDFPRALAINRELWDSATGEIPLAVAAEDAGTILHYQGEDREAMVWLARALEHWRRVPGNPQRRATVMQQLGIVCHRLGDYAGAERFLREALGEPGIGTSTRAITMNALSDLLREQGQLSEAQDLLRRAVVSPAANWFARVDSLMAMASVELEIGKTPESAAHWNQALELARANPGSDKATVYEAICLRGVGESWLERHETARALPVLRRSVYLLESVEPAEKEVFQLAGSRRALAQTLLLDSKPLQAEELAKAAIAAMAQASLIGHPQAAALFDVIAQAEAAQGRLEPALEALGRAQEILTRQLGSSSLAVITTNAERGVLEELAGQPAAAVRDLEQAVQAMGRDRMEFTRARLRLLGFYAAALEATHRKEKARAVREEIHAAAGITTIGW